MLDLKVLLSMTLGSTSHLFTCTPKGLVKITMDSFYVNIKSKIFPFQATQNLLFSAIYRFEQLPFFLHLNPQHPHQVILLWHGSSFTFGGNLFYGIFYNPINCKLATYELHLQKDLSRLQCKPIGIILNPKPKKFSFLCNIGYHLLSSYSSSLYKPRV